MQRRSYYPHNQQLTSIATSSGVASSRPVTPANDLRLDARVSVNGHSLDLNGIDAELARGEKGLAEKEYK